MRKVLFIFGVLNDSDIDWMARTGFRRGIGRQEVLIREGVPIDAMVLLLQGRMGVSVSGAGEIAQLEAGDFIGEMSLVDSVPPSATVAAKIDSVALFLDKKILLRKLAGDHAFASRFYRALAILLSDRLRATERRMAYGEQDHGLGDEAIRLKDELDPGVLDQVSVAGERFDRLLKFVEQVAMKGAKS
ncbi:CRP/FNR family cyclic AMP-dependent transcriptional regulator [Bradyrhizobium sp. LA2.1]|jgi:CRP-like cAMP-binding protein|uniref:cyclic nucleotide-binding domain-containing protein n=2 Tax=Bradyrhizobium TaxID=374 RepID=UPI0032086135|nr:cyclic nucleotide-binding domain-containing protein [Bradyrhizobium sp. 61]MCK1448053.1 cyclic nucleotide-binding domain-containing protein [Bradyrhizobium sp. 48]MCK1465447.1 cyclic nucleotide-binding domain-containing protein [Bradyrhizobium sp. 2]